jgi:chromosomal replication initiator protein
MNAWDHVKEQLSTSLSSESFENWVSRTTLDRVEGETIHVRVPDEETRAWLESEYGDLIHTLVRRLDGSLYRMVVYHAPNGRRDGYSDHDSSARDSSAEDACSRLSALNPRFTFDSFVVGASNQFAHAAARSVATNPSRSYNPLFIHGGVGMGKTHLMHAIGRALIGSSLIGSNKMRVVYTSSERFMNEVIAGIRFDHMPALRQRYRSADVLLIDDIQLLGNKERTQDELFHTFNELHDHQKQIVISSDSSPKDIPGLLDRLRSRFEWGLMADIQAPDLETKMAILDKKAEAEGVTLPEDVRTFVASRTKSNVRELEGSLIKLIAYSSLTGSPITLPMAQQCLKHLVHAQDRRVSIDAIQKAVADRFDVKQVQLKEKSNTRAIVYPRQVAMYLVKELTTASLPEIGRAFGGKHHTTVIHSIAVITKKRIDDPDLNRILHSLIDSLQKS